MTPEFRGYSHELTASQEQLNTAKIDFMHAALFPPEEQEMNGAQQTLQDPLALQFALSSLEQVSFTPELLSEEATAFLQEKGIDPQKSTAFDLLNAGGQLSGKLELRDIDGTHQIVWIEGNRSRTLDAVAASGQFLSVPAPIMDRMHRLTETQQAHERLAQFNTYQYEPANPTVTPELRRKNRIFLEEILGMIKWRMGLTRADICKPAENPGDDNQLTALRVYLSRPEIDDFIERLRSNIDLLEVIHHTDYLNLNIYALDLRFGSNFGVYQQYFKKLASITNGDKKFREAQDRWKQIRRENEPSKRGGHIVFLPIPSGTYHPTGNLPPVDMLRNELFVGHCHDLAVFKS